MLPLWGRRRCAGRSQQVLINRLPGFHATGLKHLPTPAPAHVPGRFPGRAPDLGRAVGCTWRGAHLRQAAEGVGVVAVGLRLAHHEHLQQPLEDVEPRLRPPPRDAGRRVGGGGSVAIANNQQEGCQPQAQTVIVAKG